MTLQEPCGLADEGECRVGRSEEQFGEEVILTAGACHGRDTPEALRTSVASEASRQPRLHEILIGKLGRRRIDDGRTRIDASLDRIWPHQLLTEAMNGRARQLVKSPCPVLEVRPLGDRDAMRQRLSEVNRYAAVEQFPHDAFNTLEEFGGRRLGERNGNNVLRMNGRGQEQGNPACDERGLSTAGSGLYQEGSVMLSERREAGRAVRERFGCGCLRHLRALPTAARDERVSAPSAESWSRDSSPWHRPATPERGHTTSPSQPGQTGSSSGEIGGCCQEIVGQLFECCLRLIEGQDPTVLSRIEEPRFDRGVSGDERFDRVRIQATLEFAAAVELRRLPKRAGLVVCDTCTVAVAREIESIDRTANPNVGTCDGDGRGRIPR